MKNINYCQDCQYCVIPDDRINPQTSKILNVLTFNEFLSLLIPFKLYITQEDDGLNISKKEQLSKYGQLRLGIKGEVPNTIQLVHGIFFDSFKIKTQAYLETKVRHCTSLTFLIFSRINQIMPKQILSSLSLATFWCCFVSSLASKMSDASTNKVYVVFIEKNRLIIYNTM